MDKCRICLEFKKNLCSVFEGNNGISFADMLLSVANVKIVEGAYKNSICLQCRRKLQNLYNFKKEIERSDLVLNKQLKNYKFDNISEIKAQLMEGHENNNKKITDIDFTCSSLWNNDNGCILYRNTTITKMDSYENCIETNNEALFDSDFKTMDYYVTNDDLVDFYDDQDYEPLRNKKMRGRVKKNKENEDYRTKEKITAKKEKKYPTNLKKVYIKPVFLNDIKVIPTHMNTTRKETKISKKKRRGRLDMCPHCGKMSSHLQSHILIHIGEKKHKCSDCNKLFYTPQLLRTHQMKHLSAAAFKCEQCVAVFSNKAALRNHIITHIDEKNHVCTVCNKAFKRRSTLLRHKLIHSSSAKSVKCELCNMTFVHKGGLRHHMRVHTGERPFKCEICSQPYSYKIDFNRHCLKKHGVFLKQRSVHVLNEEVVKKERELMRDLMLRVQGVITDDGPINPFQGPSAPMAFKAAVKALGSCQIPIETVL